MDASFWHARWQSNQVAFHEGEANALLVAHFDALSLPAASRVFLPLCGKTRDIAWLLSQGHRVAGAELSEIAVKDLFRELDVQPVVTEAEALTHYRAKGIDIFVGDVFDLTRGQLGPVDAVYDRAALVALPDTMRGRYAQHLAEITDNAQQLLITLDYDQDILDGPPFSISEAEIDRVHSPRYSRTPIAKSNVAGGLKGVAPADEILWLLR